VAKSAGPSWRHLESTPRGQIEASVTRARGHLGRREYRAAQSSLEDTIAQHPQAFRPRLLLSHVLLQEHKDLSAAEQSLRDVLALDPNHLEAKRNLTLLLQEVERAS